MKAALYALACVMATAPATAAPELVAEMATGRVIHSRDAQVPWHPASLTKLMTTYVALRAMEAGLVRPETRVVLSHAAVRAAPSRSGLPVGASLSLMDALRVLMVKSANDVAISIAETVGGDVPAFVARMNAESARLGMSASAWRNPNGLHDGSQVTTARDMAVLAVALARDFPAQADLFRMPAVTLDGAMMANHNNSVGRYPEVDGMKTGYTCPSGFNVVTTATRGGRRLVAVVLGQDRAMRRDALATLLLQAGFQAPAPGEASQALASLAGTSAARPPVRGCGSRDGSGEEGRSAAGMDQWVKAFAALPRRLGEPVAIRSARPGAAEVLARMPAPPPASMPLAYAPTVNAPSPAQMTLEQFLPASKADKAPIPRRF